MGQHITSASTEGQPIISRSIKYLIPILLAGMLLIRIPVAMGEDSGIRYSATVILIWVVIIGFGIAVSIMANLWVGLFVILSLVSSQYPFITQFSQETFFCILIGVGWYFICVQFLNHEAISVTMDLLCIFALLNVVFLFLQYFNIDPIYAPVKGQPEYYKMGGLAAYPHGCAAVLALCVPAFCRKKRFWGLIPVAIGLVLTRTFSGPMAIAAGLIFLIAVSNIPFKLKMIVYIAIVLVLAGYILIDVPDHCWRLRAWKIAILDLIPKHLVFGYGLGFWKIKFAQPEIIERITQVSSKLEFFQQAHNEIIQGWFEMGTGFMLIAAGYVVSLCRRFKKELILPAFALVIAFTGAQVAFPLHEAYSAAIILFWMGCYEAIAKNKSIERNK